MPNKLDLYTINNHYGNFLHNRDNKSPNVSGNKSTRPFVGIIIMVNNKNYIVPLTSPKPKHLTMRTQPDFMKIDNGVPSAYEEFVSIRNRFKNFAVILYI